MVIVIVPYPCGTIFSIILIIAGIVTLPGNLGSGISMIIVGIVFLAINEALTGSDKPRRVPRRNQGSVSLADKSNLSRMGYNIGYFCPKCGIEYDGTNTSRICPTCQIPLKTKESSFSKTQENARSFYFENQ
ncbi:MAG: hypothetical protein ACTSSO_02045 [Candidatus Hodarchaeales archaeon]